MSSTKTTQYRVAVPMIQILGHVPFEGKHGALERGLYQGDFVPAWVPAEEVARLLEGGFIQEAS
jgi:hypothetical protein